MSFSLTDLAANVASVVVEHSYMPRSTTQSSNTALTMVSKAAVLGLHTLHRAVSTSETVLTNLKALFEKNDPTLNTFPFGDEAIIPQMKMIYLYMRDDAQDTEGMLDLSLLDDDDIILILDYIEGIWEAKGLEEGVFDLEDFDEDES